MEALSCPFLMMEFVTFLPREVKSCRLSHLSASLKWLWHPLGHVSLKLIFFFLRICQVPLRERADSRPRARTKRSVSGELPRRVPGSSRQQKPSPEPHFSFYLRNKGWLGHPLEAGIGHSTMWSLLTSARDNGIVLPLILGK